MRFPMFEFQHTKFTYRQKDAGAAASVATVEFIPLGGQDFAVTIRMDGDMIDQYRHSGSFTSTHAAEYCLAGITTWLKEGKTILTPAASAPVINLIQKPDA